MKIVVSKHEIAKLRRRMIRAYPRERIEYLWGKVSGDTVYIHIFDPVKHKATGLSCAVDENDALASAEHCEQHGLRLIGTVHSHPRYEDAAPSEIDHDLSVDAGELVQGVIGVWKDKNGRMRTNVRFWGPTVPVDFQIR